MSHANQELNTVTTLFEGVCAQDEAMTAEFWELFFPRLVGLANQVLTQTLGCANDAEDVAQWAFVKFWKKAVDGGLPVLKDREGIWSLLASMTVRQAITCIRETNAWKRGGRHRILSLDGIDNFDRSIGQLSFHEFDLIVEELLNLLSAEDRAILANRMMGFSNLEISQFLNRSERHVRRRIKFIRDQWTCDTRLQ